LGAADVTETGGRAAFLANARARLDGGIHANPVHVPPTPTPTPPTVRFVALDPDDLVGTFERMATEVAAVVHRVTPQRLAETVVAIARDHDATSAVRTPEPEANTAAIALEQEGLTVDLYSPSLAADADLGLTGAVAGIAATGSVVLDASVAGGRGAGVLPPVHVCVLPEERIVATPADVLHPLADGLPSSLVLVGGPSRTGDVEQILTLGVHGPRHVHVIVVGRGDGSTSVASEA
jgi:L-lactate dehydrogenase complex protein LldG